jgi:hypothetical protein
VQNFCVLQQVVFKVLKILIRILKVVDNLRELGLNGK